MFGLQRFAAAALLAAAIAPSLAVGQVSFSKKNIPNPRENYIPLEFKAPQAVVNNGGSEVAADFTQVVEVTDILYNHYFPVTPIVYEPISKTLAFLSLSRGNIGTNTATLGGDVTIYTSTNMGVSWTQRVAFPRTDGEIPVWGSLGIENPTGSTNPNDLVYFITAGLARRSGTTFPFVGRSIMVNYDGTFENFFEAAPTTNNADNQTWLAGRTSSYTNSGSGSSFFYSSGTLNANGAGQQYGKYGFSAFDYNAASFTVNAHPPEFGLDKFRPSTDLNSSFQAPMHTDVDGDGNVYAAFNNFFSQDIDNRVPGVAKSTNNGETWGAFNRMPVSVFENYVLDEGFDIAASFAINPYQQDAFAVTGTDKYSFFYRVAVGKGSASNPTDQRLDIVEAEYNGSNWTMRKVSSINNIPLAISDGDGDKDTISANRLGNELAVARTADGTALVVKWIDYNPERNIDLPTPITIIGQDPLEFSLDTVAVTDIFMSTRELSASSWTPTVNVTDDYRYDIGTMMPSIVPSVEEVPILRAVTSRYTQARLDAYRTNFGGDTEREAVVLNHIVNTPAFANRAVVNALTGSVNVNEQETPAANARLFDLTPNPVQGVAPITFGLDAAAPVKIEVFNTMGQSVGVAFDGYATEGITAVEFNTSKLVSGTYYYSMTVGAQKITKMMVVAR